MIGTRLAGGLLAAVIVATAAGCGSAAEPPSGTTAAVAAFVYAYVLDGTVRSQLDGEPMRTYRQGENWVEQPGAHHVLTENPSTTAPAKLLVIFISNTGDPLKVDDPPPAQNHA